MNRARPRARGGFLPAMIISLVVMPSCGGGRIHSRSKPEAPRPALRFENAPEAVGFGAVSVTELSPDDLATLGASTRDPSEWARLLGVRTSESLHQSRPAVLGTYTIESNAIRFTPRFPFIESMTYTASFDGALFDSWVGQGDRQPTATPTLSIEFAMPEPPGGPTTRVVAVFPSALTVPENLLNLYIHFSAPMNPRNVSHYVHIYDASGDEVLMPFVEIEHGLWDVSNERLTLFFHPGRLKRGVAPNLALGPPLREGQTYRLVVDQELRDANGFPLTEKFERPIRVGPPDRELPDMDDWQVMSPATSDHPLRIDFPESFDRALLGRMIVVETAAGDLVEGSVVVSHDETRWEFTPAAPWSSGSYAIRIHPSLEDLAGNTLDHLFEEVTSGEATFERSSPADKIERATVTIAFEVS